MPENVTRAIAVGAPNVAKPRRRRLAGGPNFAGFAPQIAGRHLQALHRRLRLEEPRWSCRTSLEDGRPFEWPLDRGIARRLSGGETSERNIPSRSQDRLSLFRRHPDALGVAARSGAPAALTAPAFTSRCRGRCRDSAPNGSVSPTTDNRRRFRQSPRRSPA